MPSFINAVLCLKPHARGQTALLDAFRYLGTSSSPYAHTILSWTGEQHAHHHQLDEMHSEEIGDDLAKSFAGSHLAQVALPPVEEPDRWRHFAEHELYPILHSRQPSLHDYGKKHQTMWQDYIRVNEAFAAKIAHMHRPDDIICIHDYHLALVPALLREKLPEAVIGFFLNTPFPSTEFFRCLTGCERLLSGLLGSSIVFFQTSSYARSFRSACKRCLNIGSLDDHLLVRGRHVRTEVLAIGINVAIMEELAFRPGAVHRQVVKLQRQHSGQKIIVTTDRLETTRCVLLKLLAYERLLQKHSHWREKVVLVHWVNPTQVDVEKDEDAQVLSAKLSALVQRINSEFGSLTFAPVHYLPQHLAADELLALLRVAHVGFFTSVRDSMSRNALAYVVCQRDSHGPLIVSEFSGIGETVDSVIKVNPWHVDAVADSLDSTLRMTPWDCEEAHTKMYESVCENTVQDWADKLVKQLTLTQAFEPHVQQLPALHEDQVLRNFSGSQSCLIMLDYDGTLTPIVADPALATPTSKLLNTLHDLTSDPRNRVWIISGRDQAFLEAHLGMVDGLGLVAEHGCFIRHPNQLHWTEMSTEIDTNWREPSKAILEECTRLTPGSFLEQKKIGITWHHRNADFEYGAFMADEAHRLLSERVADANNAVVMRGKKNVEVRPSGACKGAAAAKLLETFMPDFAFCAGDDRTDEDMFAATKASTIHPESKVCCRVGGVEHHKSTAGHTVPSSEDVLALLELMSRRRW